MLWWNNTARLDAIVLGEQLGWGYGAGLQLILLASAWWILGRSHAPDTPSNPFRLTVLLKGNSPFLWGAIALAVLS